MVNNATREMIRKGRRNCSPRFARGLKPAIIFARQRCPQKGRSSTVVPTVRGSYGRSWQRSVAYTDGRTDAVPRTYKVYRSGGTFGRLFQVGQDFFGVSFGFHFFEDVLDFAVGADDKGGPGYAPDFLAVHILFLHHAEGFGDFLVGVGEQGEGECEFVLEFLLRFGRVGGDAEQHGAGLLHLLVRVAEFAGFDGASGRVGPGIEVEDYGLAAQGLQRDFFSVLVLQSEVGSLIIDVHGSFSGKIGVGEGRRCGIGPAICLEKSTPHDFVLRGVLGVGGVGGVAGAGRGAGRSSADESGRAQGSEEKGGGAAGAGGTAAHGEREGDAGADYDFDER